MTLYFTLDTSRSGGGKNSQILDIVPGINPNTTWDEWQTNFINNIWYAVEVDQGLRTKWSPNSVLDFYRTNLYQLASLAQRGEINQIIASSNTYPYKRNNLEKLISVADKKGQKVIKNVFQTANNLVTGIRNLKSGVLRKTNFCTPRSNYQPRSFSFEPFIKKIFHYQAFAGNTGYTSKLLFFN